MIICTITGIVILSSGININTTPTELITIKVFRITLGTAGSIFYTISTLFFAVASAVAWYCYAEASLTYLGACNRFKNIFKCLFVIFSFVGGIIKAESILYISDIFNAIMLLTNVCAMFLLTDEAKSN